MPHNRGRSASLAAFLLALGASQPALLRAQASVQWHPLGWHQFTEVTGKIDSTMSFVRELGLKRYVLRTDYRADRITTKGLHWRSTYMTASVDCGARTLEILRYDFYAADSTLVDTDPDPLPVFTAEMIAKADKFRELYNFACSIRPPDG
jgi:hypothetical protein